MGRCCSQCVLDVALGEDARNIAVPRGTYVTCIRAIQGSMYAKAPHCVLDSETRESGFISADGTRFPHLASTTPTVRMVVFVSVLNPVLFSFIFYRSFTQTEHVKTLEFASTFIRDSTSLSTRRFFKPQVLQRTEGWRFRSCTPVRGWG